MPVNPNVTAADEKLVEATLLGDISSFGIIVQRYWDMVIAFALSKIDNAIDAEDIARKASSRRIHNYTCSGIRHALPAGLAK